MVLLTDKGFMSGCALFSLHPECFNVFKAAEKGRFGFDLSIAIRRFLIHTYIRKQVRPFAAAQQRGGMACACKRKARAVRATQAKKIQKGHNHGRAHLGS